MSNGIGAVIPNDIEFRFTANGDQGFDQWGAETFFTQPMEIWHTGMTDDPSDDYKLLNYTT